MRALLHVMLAGFFVLGTSACANRGKLKTPSEIEREEAKKAHKGGQQEVDEERAKDKAFDASGSGRENSEMRPVSMQPGAPASGQPMAQ